MVLRQFFESVRNNSLEDVKKLLSVGGFDVNGARHGRTALHYAAMRGSLDLIELLISHGADLNVKTKDFNETIVHCAGVNQKPVEVFELLEKHQGSHSILPFLVNIFHWDFR